MKDAGNCVHGFETGIPCPTCDRMRALDSAIADATESVLVEAFKAIYSRSVLAPPTTTDELDRMGHFDIVRGPDETDVQFKARLIRANLTRPPGRRC